MPVSFSESFADRSGLAAATVVGHVDVSAENPYRGDACLLFSRSREMMEREETSVAFPAFAVRDGLWDVSLAMRSTLYSPDSSYCGVVRLLVYDAAGEVIEKHEIATVMGDRGWTATRKRLELPAEAVTARFTAIMEKTWGEFAVDMLAAEFAGPSLRTVTAIMFASDAVGNLFEPDRPLRFDVSAVCRRERPEAERTVNCTVRDYWGAEYDTRTIALPTAGTNDKGRPVYSGVLDLTDLPVAQGKYYEVHAIMSEPDLPEPAHDFSSFAVLPIAVTKQHPPFDVPFTASGWNPGVPGFFPLCDRLGMRVANVYSRWSSEPPYAHNAPGIEIVKELDMGALLSTPVNRVERRLPGWEAYDETAMYEGARGLIAAYKDELPIALRVGNEPHPIDDDDVRRMIRTYKAVYQGAKAADPTVTVTATSCGAEEQFFRLGYQEWHDVYIFHTYADAQVVRGHFAEYYELADKYGVRKPVWSTELGLNSNGMSRDAVATQLIKLMTNFFACGGVNASWFGIMWPDPDGRLVGTNGDSFDVFFSKYCLYSPKLTGVTEYHFVNAICIKTFVDQRTYPGGEMLTLFRDKNDRCLIVAWNDTARRATRLPLPDVGAVQTTRLDGSGGSYVAADGGLTLALSDEPYLIEFDSADLALPESLGEPAAALAGAIAPMVKGGTTRVDLRCPGVDPATITLEAPPQWQVERQTTATGASFTVTAPAVTAAYEGRLLARLGVTVGELELPVRVDDALAVRFVPAPYTAAGAGMCVELTNRGAVPQRVQWSVRMPESFAMNGGKFELKEPVPFTPIFADTATGEVELAPGASVRREVRVANLDPLTLYNARLELNCDGRVRSQERLFGGCVGVPRVQGGVTFDGKMGDPAWAQAPVLHLDQPGQVAFITRKTAKWDGPDDLSGTMHFLWDDEYLYLGMKVRDSVYCNPEVGNLIYRGDSLQFLIDPCRETSQKPGRYDYIVALTRDGVQAWCHSSADAAKAPSREVYDFKLRVTPTGERGDMVYEVAIPWHRVSPFVPVPGGNLGLGMIINNDDGQIRDSFIAWFGCAHSKQLSMNGDLILLP